MQVNHFYGRTGREIPNQLKIRDDEGNRWFQSYGTNIVKITSDGEVYLDEYYYDYSVTTGKYRNEFLGENLQETRKKIKSGEYHLTNLN